jgi:hypothetical protein
MAPFSQELEPPQNPGRCTEGIDRFEERDGPAVGGECGTNDKDAVLLDDIGPVDEDDRMLEMPAEGMTQRAVEGESFAMKMRIG